MVESIRRAHDNLSPGAIFINRGTVEECGRNRSPLAYANNPEPERNRYPGDTDNEMLLIKFVKSNGKAVGCLSWYAIHPTNRGNKNRLISSDNKGYASYLFERDMGTNILAKETFVAAFANSNCGDVSGNVQYGVPDLVHDFIHMQEFGNKQYTRAKELFDAASEQLTGGIDYRHTNVDMSNVHIDGTAYRTYAAALGASMFAGSSEDSTSEFGIPEGIRATSSGDLPPGARVPLLEAVTLLSGLLSGFEFPGVLDDELKKGHGNKPIVFAQGLCKPYPLSPEVLPLQILRIGNLILTAVPGEMTTMAGRRMKETVLGILNNPDVRYSALTTYANAYAGYITTREEYDMQHYEGASTHFGPYTLQAYQQEFGRLAKAMREGSSVSPGPAPRDLSTRQSTLQTGVIADTQPLPWVPLGSVETDADPYYNSGGTVRVVFWGGHPKNNLRTQGTFLEVQRRNGTEWTPIFTDRDPCTVYRWQRDFIANSKITITWMIPADAKPGEYRLRHYGDARDIAGTIRSYQGTSHSFTIGENISPLEIHFCNSYGKEVELWFYHPRDGLRWAAASHHLLKPHEKYSWKLPPGWGQAQVRFSGPGKWRTIAGGESINITAHGDIENVV